MEVKFLKTDQNGFVINYKVCHIAVKFPCLKWFGCHMTSQLVSKSIEKVSNTEVFFYVFFLGNAVKNMFFSINRICDKFYFMMKFFYSTINFCTFSIILTSFIRYYVNIHNFKIKQFKNLARKWPQYYLDFELSLTAKKKKINSQRTCLNSQTFF